MLTRLHVKNFRLLRSVSLEVTPRHPIVLIGPNSAGKSSVIDVMDVLARAASVPLEKALAPFGQVHTIGSAEPMEIEIMLAGTEEEGADVSRRMFGVDGRRPAALVSPRAVGPSTTCSVLPTRIGHRPAAGSVHHRSDPA